MNTKLSGFYNAYMENLQMMVEANSIIQIRCMQMMLGNMSPLEATRKIMEKPSALAQANEMAMRALVSNKSMGAVMSAALKPIGKKTKANANRLSKRSR